MARLTVYSVSVSLWLATAATVAGQATVEYGLGAGRAAGMAASGKDLGKAIGGIIGNLDKTVNAATTQPAPATAAKPSTTAVKPAGKTPAAAAAPAVQTPPPPAPTYEDPAEIATGLTYTELVRRFGPPAMEISGSSGSSLTYSGKAGMFQLEVQDGKVASIQKPKS